MKDFAVEQSSKELSGTSLSSGLAFGTAYRVEPRVSGFYRIQIRPEEAPQELERLDKALKQSRWQLEQIREKFQAKLGKEQSYIIEAHLLMLEDPHFLGEIENKIKQELESSERAVTEVGEQWLAIYRSLQDPFFRERGSDLQEVVERIISNLSELDSSDRGRLPSDLILVAPEMSLSVLADYELDKVKGLVLSTCGRTSHVTIIARSYQIPVVSGIEGVEERIRTGDTIIVDGFTGTIYVNPSPERLQRYRERIEEEGRRAQAVVEDRVPSTTLDGRRMFLYINTEVGGEVPSGLRSGAEGVGLFRSEYIYMKNKKGAVGEEQQFEIYKKLASTVQERPAIVRTLDIGDGRHPYFSSIAAEGDSVLGLRGIRLSLKFPEIFRTQVRAILRAAHFGNLKIVLPMVSSADEVMWGRKVIREVHEGLKSEGVPTKENIEVGVMLEVPAAVLALEGIADHADFLAVGTNDLIQYMLAAGRNNDEVAYLYNPLHPAVLGTLKQVARVAQERGRTTFVCGEMAAHPVHAYLLIGMGYQHLSMNPYAINGIKKIVRETSYVEACQTVDHLLGLGTVEEIESFAAQRFSSWSYDRIQN